MVAPSFKDFEIVGDATTIKGKQFVTVKNPKTGNLRTVRWYSDVEFAKLYGKKLLDETKEEKGFAMLKHARGFDKGPILVIRGNKPSDEDWLRASVARNAVGIGWYIASEDQLPQDAPPHFKYLLLGWNEFRLLDDCHCKDPNDIAKILAAKEKNKEWINL